MLWVFHNKNRRPSTSRRLRYSVILYLLLVEKNGVEGHVGDFFEKYLRMRVTHVDLFDGVATADLEVLPCEFLVVRVAILRIREDDSCAGRREDIHYCLLLVWGKLYTK